MSCFVGSQVPCFPRHKLPLFTDHLEAILSKRKIGLNGYHLHLSTNPVVQCG